MIIVVNNLRKIHSRRHNPESVPSQLGVLVNYSNKGIISTICRSLRFLKQICVTLSPTQPYPQVLRIIVSSGRRMVRRYERGKLQCVQTLTPHSAELRREVDFCKTGDGYNIKVGHQIDLKKRKEPTNKFSDFTSNSSFGPSLQPSTS